MTNQTLVPAASGTPHFSSFFSARERSGAGKKPDFMASLSHQFRTPLNSIIGFSELILDGHTGSLNEEQRDCLRDVVRNARSLLNLVNSSLSISRLEAGMFEYHPRGVALPGLIEEITRSLRPLFAEKEHELRVQIPARLPPLHVDEVCLTQIMINLLSNAIKFTPPGGKIVIEAAEENGVCLISVSDNGIGIKWEDIGRLFEAFYQADSGQQCSGTGLGLAITRQLVELSGGMIWVTSTPGRGSRFHFTIPLDNARSAAKMSVLD